MAKYCRVENGAIVERREMTPESIPTHKAALWLPLVDDGWPSVPQTETVERVETIEPTRVVADYFATRRSDDEIRGMIKDEARRRILADYPDWKQANMTARGVELLQIKMARAWDAQEQAEADALSAALARIKCIRAASNVLEASMPDDFAADAHWPE